MSVEMSAPSSRLNIPENIKGSKGVIMTDMVVKSGTQILIIESFVNSRNMNVLCLLKSF